MHPSGGKQSGQKEEPDPQTTILTYIYPDRLPNRQFRDTIAGFDSHLSLSISPDILHLGTMKPTSCQLSFFFTSLFAMNIMSRAVSEESMTYNQYHSFLHNHHGKRNKSKTVTPNKNTKFYLGTCTDDFKDEQRTKVIEEHFTSLTTANGKSFLSCPNFDCVCMLKGWFWLLQS